MCSLILKQLKRAGVPTRDLLHFYTAIGLVRPVLEYACLVWHSGLTVGQCNAIENIQKRVIRVVYSDTDSDRNCINCSQNGITKG